MNQRRTADRCFLGPSIQPVGPPATLLTQWLNHRFTRCPIPTMRRRSIVQFAGVGEAALDGPNQSQSDAALADEASNDGSDATQGEAANGENMKLDNMKNGNAEKAVLDASEHGEQSVLDVEDETGPSKPAIPNPNDPGPPPDGGYGWVIIAASFMIHAIVFAPQYAYGVYVRYYYSSNRFGEVSLTMLAFAGSVAAAGCPALGPISGRMADLYGGRPVILFGAVMLVLGFIFASFSTQLWQLFLTQGLMYGIGQSFTYFPYMGVM